MPPSPPLQRRLESAAGDGRRGRRAAAEADELLAAALDGGTRRRPAGDDLAGLFALYDGELLEGALGEELARRRWPLGFRLSRRMTRSGGATRVLRRPGGGVEVEIVVSALLVENSFGGPGRPIRVAGRHCRGPASAVARIFEHEWIHLAETVAWGATSCRRRRFSRLARGLFGHREATHRLVTQAELAHARHGVAPGVRVAFVHGGRRHLGLVQRITRRATVLVEDPEGAPHPDGHRYARYYVPLPLLEAVPGGDGGRHPGGSCRQPVV